MNSATRRLPQRRRVALELIRRRSVTLPPERAQDSQVGRVGNDFADLVVGAAQRVLAPDFTRNAVNLGLRHGAALLAENEGRGMPGKESRFYEGARFVLSERGPCGGGRGFGLSRGTDVGLGKHLESW